MSRDCLRLVYTPSSARLGRLAPRPALRLARDGPLAQDKPVGRLTRARHLPHHRRSRPRGSPMSVRSLAVTSAVCAAAALAACTAAPPPAPARAVLGRRGEHRRHAAGDDRGAGHLASAGRAVPAAHRALRRARQRHTGRQRGGARRGRPSRRRAQGWQGAGAAARHSDRAQGQHPHHRHADDRRRGRLRRLRPALRRDPDGAPARRRRGDSRQDRAHRAGQLHRPGHAGQLQRAGRLRAEPLRPAPRPA